MWRKDHNLSCFPLIIWQQHWFGFNRLENSCTGHSYKHLCCLCASFFGLDSTESLCTCSVWRFFKNYSLKNYYYLCPMENMGLEQREAVCQRNDRLEMKVFACFENNQKWTNKQARQLFSNAALWRICDIAHTTRFFNSIRSLEDCDRLNSIMAVRCAYTP